MKPLAVAFLLTIFWTLSWAQSPPGTPVSTPASPVQELPNDSIKPMVLDTVKKAPTYEGDIISPDSGVFIIESRHRMYPSFLQVDTVVFGEKFELADEGIFAEPVLFNPHVAIFTNGSAVKDSDTLMNPGLRIRVTDQTDSTLQESWAFYYIDTPHFRRDSFFAFKLVDFKLTGQNYIPGPPKNGQGK